MYHCSKHDFMKKDNLIRWLADEKSAAYFGKSFSIRADVLAHLIAGTGGSLADIARRHGVSRQSAHRHFRQALAIYGQPSTRG